MPIVNSRHYAYTPEGKKMAEKARKRKAVSVALDLVKKMKKGGGYGKK